MKTAIQLLIVITLFLFNNVSFAQRVSQQTAQQELQQTENNINRLNSNTQALDQTILQGIQIVGNTISTIEQINEQKKQEDEQAEQDDEQNNATDYSNTQQDVQNNTADYSNVTPSSEGSHADENVYNNNINYSNAWFQKAVIGINSYAMTVILYMRQNSYGVVKWQQEAANAGSADAMNSLGFIYEKGLGVNKDTNMAISWYKKAATDGSQDANESLKRLIGSYHFSISL